MEGTTGDADLIHSLLRHECLQVRNNIRLRALDQEALRVFSPAEIVALERGQQRLRIIFAELELLRRFSAFVSKPPDARLLCIAQGGDKRIAFARGGFESAAIRT